MSTSWRYRLSRLAGACLGLIVLLALWLAVDRASPLPPCRLETYAVEPAPDWKALEVEASARLSELLQIPSVNPPGNEEPAARWIQSVFAQEGIPCEVQLTAPGRALAMARIKGKSQDGALCLANHIDVVPAEPKVWLSPELPFSGKIMDGRIYGRGALDMKGFVVMQMMTLILVHRLKIPLEHDLVFLALPDEEGSGKMGAEWVVREAPRLLNGIVAMWNEGGAGIAPKAGKTRVPVFGLCHGERGSLWLELIAKGPGGHGSTAPNGNAPSRLFEATRRILEEPEVMTLTPIAAEMFASMAEASEFPLSFVLPRLGNPLIAALADRSLKGDRFTRAVTRNTRNLTTWEMGRKINVVPAEGRVGIDIRLLPGVKPETELKRIQNLISDLEIELRVSSMSEGSISPKDSRLFEVIHSTLNRLVPEAKVAPLLSPGGTDSAAFRPLGIHCYGLIPAIFDEAELAGFHGANENMRQEALREGTRITFEASINFCQKP